METLIREATDWFLIILLLDDREGFMTAIYVYKIHESNHALKNKNKKEESNHALKAVSYTHLTLPTSVYV